MNALLTQKRILFLGPGLSAGEVSNYVLAACALGSGCGTVLRGFTERAYPYTNLASVDELEKWFVDLSHVDAGMFALSHVSTVFHASAPAI